MPPRACNVRTNAGPARAPRPPLTATTRRPRRTRSRTTYTTGRVRSPITFRMTTDRGCARSGRSGSRLANSYGHTRIRDSSFVYPTDQESQDTNVKYAASFGLGARNHADRACSAWRMIIDSPSATASTRPHVSAPSLLPAPLGLGLGLSRSRLPAQRSQKQAAPRLPQELMLAMPNNTRI